VQDLRFEPDYNDGSKHHQIPVWLETTVGTPHYQTMTENQQQRENAIYWGKIAVAVYAVVVIPAWVTGYVHNGPHIAQILIFLVNAVGFFAAWYAIISAARYYQ
jgi:hypothetical protein